MNPIDQMIECKLLGLHTAFLGLVVEVHGDEATIQPLNLIKQYGQAPQKQAVVTSVPILRHVKKIVLYETVVGVDVLSAQVPTHGGHAHGVNVAPHGGHVRLEPIQSGDIVFCMCADRDISQTRSGKLEVPVIGHHQLQDAVVVGVLS